MNQRNDATLHEAHVEQQEPNNTPHQTRIKIIDPVRKPAVEPTTRTLQANKMGAEPRKRSEGSEKSGREGKATGQRKKQRSKQNIWFKQICTTVSWCIATEPRNSLFF